jgi:hypothetical protein
VRTCDLLPAGPVPVSATAKVKVSKGRAVQVLPRQAAGGGVTRLTPSGTGRGPKTTSRLALAPVQNSHRKTTRRTSRGGSSDSTWLLGGNQVGTDRVRPRPLVSAYVI